MFQKFAHPRRERFHIRGRDIQGGIAAYLRQRCTVRSNNGRAAGHGFKDRKAEPFIFREIQESTAAAQEGRDSLVGEKARQVDLPGFCAFPHDSAAVPALLPYKQEVRIRMFFHQAAKCTDNAGKSFSWLHGSQADKKRRMGGDAKSTQDGFRLPSVCRMKMIAAAKEGYAYLVPIRTGEEGEEVLPCKLGIGPDDVRFPQMLAHEIKARLVKRVFVPQPQGDDVMQHNA